MSDAQAALEARVARLPDEPGVYQWLDDAGRTLYVGKAARLRSRVRSYLGKGDGRPLVRLLMRRAVRVEVTTTATPSEALLLENTLIKRERPPYNLRLKDDKSYLLVRVDRSHTFPRLRLVRKIKKDGAQYVGPFASAKGVRRTLRFLGTLYPLRTCSDRELEERTRPCLYHQIGRCAAPCVDAISASEYDLLLRGALALLRGRDNGAASELRREMEAASEAQLFERAAVFRDRLHALESALTKQEVVTVDGKDRDVLAVVQAGGVSMLSLVYVRDGQVVATRALAQHTTVPGADVIHGFLAQCYARDKVIPAEFLVDQEPTDREGLEAMLSELRGTAVSIRVPRRGTGRDLIAMAVRNAEMAIKEHNERARQSSDALARLATLLGLPTSPSRIEGYDLSHLAGSDPVAGLSVLIGGVPEPSSYRHFAIREAAGGDDYAGMREVIARRFARGVELGVLPDLVLVDGGRGQVEAARAALDDLGGIDIPLVGLAKARTAFGERSDERIVRLEHPEPLILKPDDPGLRLLVTVRDEAHRFAGRYQQKRRQKTFSAGALDAVSGIGPAKKRRLLKHFGSVDGIRDAPYEDLAAIPGIGPRLARLIRDTLG